MFKILYLFCLNLFISLADSENFWAKLDSLFNKDLGKNWHGKRSNGGDKVITIVSVSILATEAISLEVDNSLGNGGFISHVCSGSGKNIGALFAGPVTWGEDGSLLAESKPAADISLKDEVVVDAAGHVWEPHVNGGFTGSNIIQLWADKSLKERSLLSKALLSEEMINKTSWNENKFKIQQE